MDETKVQIGEDVLLDIGTHSDWYISAVSYDGESVNVDLRRKAARHKEWWLADTPQTEETCERCVYVRGSQWCQGCNGTPKKWDGEKIVDAPQTDCETCNHYKLACELFSEVCKYEPITQTETQNSNLTFEKSDCPWK